MALRIDQTVAFHIHVSSDIILLPKELCWMSGGRRWRNVQVGPSPHDSSEFDRNRLGKFGDLPYLSIKPVEIAGRFAQRQFSMRNHRRFSFLVSVDQKPVQCGKETFLRLPVAPF